MHFGITKIKSIGSAVIAIIAGFSGIPMTVCFDCSPEQVKSAVTFQFLIGFLISFLIVFSVWSLFDNKKKK